LSLVWLCLVLDLWWALVNHYKVILVDIIVLGLILQSQHLQVVQDLSIISTWVIISSFVLLFLFFRAIIIVCLLNIIKLLCIKFIIIDGRMLIVIVLYFDFGARLASIVWVAWLPVHETTTNWWAR